MQRAAISAVLLLLLNPGVSSAQNRGDPVYRDIGLAFGLNGYQLKEKVLNNVRHKGTLLSGSLFYKKQREDSIQRMELNLIYNELGSRYDPEKDSIIIDTALNYRTARRIKDLNSNLGAYLGGTVGLDSHISFFENWDDSHGYWLTSYFIGVDGILDYRTSEKGSLSLELAMPVVALVSRPPERFLFKSVNPEFSWIIRQLHENIRLTTIHRHFSVDMQLRYTLRHSRRFGQILFWRFRYTKNSMPESRDIHILNHTLGLAFFF